MSSTSTTPVAGRSGTRAGSRASTHGRSTLRAIALPSEHGGWSLTLEPALLGLLVAWSWSGLAVGAAATLSFLARTPLRIVLVDRWRHRHLPRTRTATRLVLAEVAAIATLVAAAGLAAGWSILVPLVAAVPLVGVELWFDMRSRSRRLVPELAGTIGIGATAAAIGLAGGLDGTVALGLWCVVAARGGAAVAHVRTQVLRLHGRAHARWHSDLAQVLAAVAVAAAWVRGAIPVAPLVASGAIGVHNAVAVRRPPHRPTVLGVQQMVVGLTVVAVTATAVHNAGIA